VIVNDPENASLESDNADALVKLYESFSCHDERERFRAALLARVSRDSVYAPIAYLPLLVALRLDFAPRFFERAFGTLLGDADYGFSNCLMLLDGLLRLQHPMFSESLLDDVERFADTDEHPFQIPERIAAIKAARLSQRRRHADAAHEKQQRDCDNSSPPPSARDPDS
jgi:hypothetical protein